MRRSRNQRVKVFGPFVALQSAELCIYDLQARFYVAVELAPNCFACSNDCDFIMLRGSCVRSPYFVATTNAGLAVPIFVSDFAPSGRRRQRFVGWPRCGASQGQQSISKCRARRFLLPRLIQLVRADRAGLFGPCACKALFLQLGGVRPYHHIVVEVPSPHMH